MSYRPYDVNLHLDHQTSVAPMLKVTSWRSYHDYQACTAVYRAIPDSCPFLAETGSGWKTGQLGAGFSRRTRSTRVTVA